MTEWQPIETAPRDGTLIIIAYKVFGRYRVYPASYGVGGFVDSDFAWGILDHDGSTNAVKTGEPTHWMPLPEPPEEA